MNPSTSLRRNGTVLAVTTCLLVGGSVTTLGAASAEQAAPVRLEARLRPSGDPDGAGQAVFRLNRATQRVCANVEWRRIGAPQAAHIHRKSDSAVVVDLVGSVTGGNHCAGKVSRALISAIIAHPGRYYFNVHNAKYPAGAIQGALHR